MRLACPKVSNGHWTIINGVQSDTASACLLSSTIFIYVRKGRVYVALVVSIYKPNYVILPSSIFLHVINVINLHESRMERRSWLITALRNSLHSLIYARGRTFLGTFWHSCTCEIVTFGIHYCEMKHWQLCTQVLWSRIFVTVVLSGADVV